MLIKGFDKDLKCRGMQFEVGKIYEIEGAPRLCENGFHYCDSIANVNSFYDLRKQNNNRFCEIEALGQVDYSKEKSCTNKIKIVREIVGKELEKLINLGEGNTGILNTGNMNTGDWNTGYWNTGDRNTGNRNTGDWNTGNRNTGNMNTGNWNTGDRNTGDCNTGNMNTGYCNTGNMNTGNRNTGNRNTGDRNTGYRNTGDRNTGNWNTGNWNTGDMNTGHFNSCDFSNGIFCTESPKINIFNMPTEMTYKEFASSIFYSAIVSSNFDLTKWVTYTPAERKEDPKKEMAGGYLVTYTFKEACANWWNGLDDTNKDIIKSIPNFDSAIFEDITGIKV